MVVLSGQGDSGEEVQAGDAAEAQKPVSNQRGHVLMVEGSEEAVGLLGNGKGGCLDSCSVGSEGGPTNRSHALVDRDAVGSTAGYLRAKGVTVEGHDLALVRAGL